MTTPSPGTGYGTGFWLNNTHVRNEMSGDWGLPGAPADAYFARGYLGQFVVMVPSAELVVVRMAVNHGRGGDAPGMGRLVGAVVAAVQPASAPGRMHGHPSAAPTPAGNAATP